MKAREVRQLMLRAAAALETPNDLSFDDKQYLIHDLCEAADTFDATVDPAVTPEGQLVDDDNGSMFKIQYSCPECGNSWTEYWPSACDSTCESCGLRNVTALSYEEVTRDDEGAEQ